jgi:predicted nucleic acid-binding protein
MFLADTSVWIEHFREEDIRLTQLLIEGRILIHPFVCGELACGSLRNRTSILCELNELPAAALARHTEVLMLIEEKKLWSLGLGWVDCHLLASSLLSGCRLWTMDKRLAQEAIRLGVG